MSTEKHEYTINNQSVYPDSFNAEEGWIKFKLLQDLNKNEHEDYACFMFRIGKNTWLYCYHAQDGKKDKFSEYNIKMDSGWIYLNSVSVDSCDRVKEVLENLVLANHGLSSSCEFINKEILNYIRCG